LYKKVDFNFAASDNPNFENANKTTAGLTHRLGNKETKILVTKRRENTLIVI